MPEMLEDDGHMAMEESNDAYTEDSSEDKIVLIPWAWNS